MLPDIESVLSPISIDDLILISAGMMLAGFVRGFVGFGASLIIVMVVSVALGPLLAVPIAALSGLPPMIQLLPTAVKYSEKTFVLPFGIAALIAAPFGTWLLVTLEPTIVKIFISGFVLAMVYVLYKDWRLPNLSDLPTLIAVGATAGVIQGAAGVGGPPAVVIALSRSSTTERQRANVIGAVTTLNISSLMPLWYHGLFTEEVLIITLILLPFHVGSTWLGAKFFLRFGHAFFRNGALIILATLSISTLVIAFLSY
ncbi:MAG: hypothetical protein CMM58_04030 [Rhodospirillaceae bacterium]|nr:hypothetical protein [Rhodospirillaceae bacterium]|tara:strand:+ start:893 stop:1663 length:771 start_codon:yes stop_codon:yes gene_type:complete